MSKREQKNSDLRCGLQERHLPHWWGRPGSGIKTLWCDGKFGNIVEDDTLEWLEE